MPFSRPSLTYLYHPLLVLPLLLSLFPLSSWVVNPAPPLLPSPLHLLLAQEEMLLVFYTYIVWYYFLLPSLQLEVPSPGPCFANRPPFLLHPHWPNVPALFLSTSFSRSLLYIIFFFFFFCFSSQKIIYICCFYILNHFQSGSCLYQTMEAFALKVTYDSGSNLLFLFFPCSDHTFSLSAAFNLADNPFWNSLLLASVTFHTRLLTELKAHTVGLDCRPNHSTFWGSLCLCLPFEKGIIVPTA